MERKDAPVREKGSVPDLVYAVHRANLDTLRLVIMALAFRAKIRVDRIYLASARNCVVRANGFADVADYAFIADRHRHIASPGKIPSYVDTNAHCGQLYA